MDFDHTVANDLSGWYRCPNEMAPFQRICEGRSSKERGVLPRAAVVAKACPGGHFNASSVPGEPVEDVAVDLGGGGGFS